MLKNASAGEKAGWFNGRTPLFSQKDLLRLVGPLLIEQFLAVTVGMADTMMVSRCGEAAISGVSLVDMINNLIIVLFAALATGGAVVVSQYLGAKEQEKANASAGQLILLSAILGTVVAALCILFARPMISACYGSIDADQRPHEHHQHRGQRGLHLRPENGRRWRCMAQCRLPCHRGGAHSGPLLPERPCPHGAEDR